MAVTILVILALPLSSSDIRGGELTGVPGVVYQQLPRSERDRIDSNSLSLPTESHRARNREFYGDIAGWAIARTPFSQQEERRWASRMHAEVLKRSAAVETPKAAEVILQKLVETLPSRMRPRDWDFELTVLDKSASSAVFTIGGGYLYITRSYYDSLVEHKEGSSDRLAFVLAHQLGHICRNHNRRGYRLLRLQEELEDEIDSRVDRDKYRKLLSKSVRLSGKLATFLYDREQAHTADLFALHLCRNAGYDVESGLDVLRCEANGDEVPKPSAPQAQDDEPVGKRKRANPLTPRVRLRHLRRELDGIPGDPDYGLYRYDRSRGYFEKVEDGALADAKRGVVFLHGIESDITSQSALVRSLAREPAARDLVLLGFAYPDDDSLARSGKLLHNSLVRAGVDSQGFDFVCHSAGGLVFRYYAEIENGKFHRAIFQGTPHDGSNWAQLRPLLEAKQFVGDVPHGFPSAIEKALTDGKGQISFDLEPESLFLSYLNRSPRPGLRQRYYIVRGHAISNPTALIIMKGVVFALRQSLRRKVTAEYDSQLHRRGLRQWLSSIELPPEVTAGDLVVSLESAALEGVAGLKTYSVHHIELLDDPRVVADIQRILLSANHDR
jgi:pimeloyl-ACP methyl ester carboxylesterase